MIKYALQCSKGHTFDGWFRSSDAYDRQVRRKMVTCPHCGVTKVEKQPMAPALVTSRQRAKPEVQVEASPSIDKTVPVTTPAQPPVEMLRAFRKHIVDNSEDVGSRFAEEARKIHHGEAESRSIRGETSADEAAKLHEEGVEFGVLPLLPEDHN
ncbi:MAG: DUF1178 family protein [Hyphomicrobiaceae bacterium]|nr:DUF1178 family protein [Hyphomicrobiaceae bacterium]